MEAKEIGYSDARIDACEIKQNLFLSLFPSKNSPHKDEFMSLFWKVYMWDRRDVANFFPQYPYVISKYKASKELYLPSDSKADLTFSCSICFSDEQTLKHVEKPSSKTICLIRLPCNHLFDARCIRQWQSAARLSHPWVSCPNCRYVTKI